MGYHLGMGEGKKKGGSWSDQTQVVKFLREA